MRNVISYEFSTPVLLDRWGSHEQHKDELIKAIKLSISNHQSTAVQRGQENGEIFGSYPQRSDARVDRLKAIYRSKIETNDDLHLSHNVSIRSLLFWIIEQARKLIDLIGADATHEFRPYVLNCWASVYKIGDNHDVHIHPASLLSCVYCLSTTEGIGGALILHDPRPNINYNHFECGLWSNNARMIDLQPGELIIFPGWLPHSVTPIRGATAERITISINLDARHFPLGQGSIPGR